MEQILDFDLNTKTSTALFVPYSLGNGVRSNLVDRMQLGKDKTLGYDPCCGRYFGNSKPSALLPEPQTPNTMQTCRASGGRRSLTAAKPSNLGPT